MDNEIPEWMQVDGMREIEFSEFEYKKKYSFILTDVTNVEERKFKQTIYLVFNAVTVMDYLELHINKGESCKVHFSKICFQKQWWKVCREKFEKGKRYDMFIEFGRRSKDKFFIYTLNYTNTLTN